MPAPHADGPGKGRKPVEARNRRRRSIGRGLLTAALTASCFGAVGCGSFWDDVTRRDFSFNRLYSHPDPLVVLRDSQDPDDRARALRAYASRCRTAAIRRTRTWS